MHAHKQVTITKASKYYQTEPWGLKDQDWFVNICALGETTLSPHALLNFIKETEEAVGRKPGIRWGPRVIDIDILFFGHTELEDPNLTLPHKSMKERAFVLYPLAEIAGDFTVGNLTVSLLKEEIMKEKQDITKMKQDAWSPVKI